MDSATLVWIAPEAPDAGQSHAISSWALGRSLTLVLPTDQRPTPVAAVTGERVADDVETLIDHARDAIVAHDTDGADRALSSAESLLRAHAELPQAAWLMAEVERCRSARWSRLPPGDAEAAGRAWTRAEALDGGRTPGIAEKAFALRPAAATVGIGLTAAEGMQAWLDGKGVTATVETSAGPHALVVTWAGTPVWAQWIEVPAGSSSIAVDAPSPPRCSRSDVGLARIFDGEVHPGGVRCPHWVAASPGNQPGEVRLASCAVDGCGPPLLWLAPSPWTRTPPASSGPKGSDRSGRWPAWATWSAVGAGAAVVAGAVVILVDALKPAQPETRFVNNGLEKE
ncbi:MAG: hypothetical protein ACLP1X_00745 [Polyangiaceae bacterium]|jgi:hypothetical protein